MLAPELMERARALEAIGFTTVRAEAWSFVAVRSKWHWDLAIHMTTVLYVRRLQSATMKDAQEGRAAVVQLGDQWDPSKLPRGFQHGRALVDVIIADQADGQVLQYARSNVGKGFGGSQHTVVMPASGGEPALCVPIFGRAFWVKTEQAIKTACAGRVQPASPALLGMFIAFGVMYPGLLLIGAMCCGVPLALGAWAVIAEDPLPSALPPPDQAPYRGG